MRRVAIATALLGAVIASGCTTGIEPTPEPSPPPEARNPSNPNSQIVAGIFNSYEERTELPIDPCQDSFISTMETLGYALSSSVEPNTSLDYGYWFTGCIYRGSRTSMDIETTNSPNLAAQLKPADSAFLDSYETSIANRFAVVRPLIDNARSCWVGMETSFGSIIVTGGPLPDKSAQGENACEDMTDFLRELEPLLGD